MWWRDEVSSTEARRGHVVGWSTTDGSKSGRCTIDSDHLRLSRQQIETHLSTRLEAEVADRPLQPAYERWDDLNPAVRIMAGGHQLVAFDLQRHYGPECVAGVSAELRGQGIAARVVLACSLLRDEKEENLVWAEHQLSMFRTMHPQHLREHQWTEITPSRWQIFRYRS